MSIGKSSSATKDNPQQVAKARETKRNRRE